MATETIYALFQTVADAERAIGALMDHGVSRNDIGIIARQPAEQDEEARVRAGFTRITDPTDAAFGEPVAAYAPRPETPPPAAIEGTVEPASSIDTPDNVETVGKEGITTTTAADAGLGAAVGTGLGLGAGILASAVALTIPGFGIILAAGAVSSAIGLTIAAAAAGAVAGGVAGYLRDMGMNEAAATSYAERLSQGDYLLAVNVDTNNYDDVCHILYKYNAVGVDININDAGGTVRGGWTVDAAVVDEPAARLGSPAPVRHIVAEEPDGTPIIPAREIEDVTPSAWRDPAIDVARAEAAIDHDAEVDDEINAR